MLGWVGILIANEEYHRTLLGAIRAPDVTQVKVEWSRPDAKARRAYTPARSAQHMEKRHTTKSIPLAPRELFRESSLRITVAICDCNEREMQGV